VQLRHASHVIDRSRRVAPSSLSFPWSPGDCGLRRSARVFRTQSILKYMLIHNRETNKFCMTRIGAASSENPSNSPLTTYLPLVAATISSEFPRPAGWPWELGPSNAVTPVSSSARQAPCRNALGTRPGHATSRVGPKVATATSPPLRLPDCQRPRFRHQVFATSRRSARGRSTQIPLALI
jgi:hypothetical protein